MRISQYYGLPDPENLPFVDVNVHQDSALYVDPRVIKLDPSPARHVAHAKESMTTYFNTVSDCILCGDEISRARGLMLLQNFAKPWQTRLGVLTGDVDLFAETATFLADITHGLA